MTGLPAFQARTEHKFNPVPELVNANSGIGLRAPHFDVLLEQRPRAGWLETHSENYFCPGGVPDKYLEKIRELYPLSLHGVGLSLGSAQGLDPEHLCQLKALVHKFEPALVSDHLSWSASGERAVPDLLPLPMTRQSLDVFCANIDRAQSALGRPILIENPSLYATFSEQEMSETEFLTQTAAKTGCGLLIDVNNIHVCAHNLGVDSRKYLSEIPASAVGEIHLAGYQINKMGDQDIYIDAHNNPVYDAVWDLYVHALELFGNVPTMIEWDNDLPPLERLAEEAAKADVLRRKHTSWKKADERIA